ncbi:Rod shape-determining protein RodA [Rickettsia prowazekii str. Breinl]|nr:Rod shape-determining protein RodA [Rickettsia prowazekii str. NMRC Madrid E]AGJ02564.1 Rod shape-determining protein RodA [Rickettsia prowazekii str. Breinl]
MLCYEKLIQNITKSLNININSKPIGKLLHFYHFIQNQ